MRYENDIQGRCVRIQRLYRCILQTKPAAELLRKRNVYKQKLHKVFFYDKIILVSIKNIYLQLEPLSDPYGLVVENGRSLQRVGKDAHEERLGSGNDNMIKAFT